MDTTEFYIQQLYIHSAELHFIITILLHHQWRREGITASPLSELGFRSLASALAATPRLEGAGGDSVAQRVIGGFRGAMPRKLPHELGQRVQGHAWALMTSLTGRLFGWQVPFSPFTSLLQVAAARALHRLRCLYGSWEIHYCSWRCMAETQSSNKQRIMSRSTPAILFMYISVL